MIAKLKRWLSWRRLYCSVIKQEGSPESVAKGVALGIFVGFLMPVGGQIVVAVPLSFLIRANKILSVMFTMLTNPYTVPFIYPFQCWLGGWLIGSPLKFETVKAQFRGFFSEPSWTALLDLGGDFVAPFFAGGLAMAVAGAIPSYYFSLSLVRRRRARKAARKAALRAGKTSDA